MPPTRPRVGSTFEEVATATLAMLRERLGWETWGLMRRVGEVVVVLASVDGIGILPVGMTVPADDAAREATHGTHAPRFIGDIAAVPELAGFWDAVGVPVRAQLAVPILDRDGNELGSLGAVSLTPQPASPFDEPGRATFLTVAAEMLGNLLERELELSGWSRQVEQVEASARSDAVTELPGRRAWDAALISEEERCARLALPAAIVLIELEGLDAINRAHGRAAGDDALRGAALVVRACSAESDLIVRLGGNTFGVLLADTEPADVASYVDRVVAAPTAWGTQLVAGHAIRVPAAGLHQAWTDADAALQRAKAAVVAERPPAPILPVQREPEVRGRDEDEAQMLWLLQTAAARLDMSVAYVAEIRDGVQTYEYLWSSTPLPVGPGDWTTAEDSYCARMLDGTIPCVIRDSRSVEGVAHLPATTSGLVGSYVAVPVRLADGTVYGSLCVFRAEPHDALDDTSEALLRVLAEAAGRIVERRMRSDRREHRTLEAVDAIIAAQGPQMAFQPIIDLRRGTVFAVEALARFPGSRLPVPEWFRRDAEARGDQRLERAALISAARSIPLLDSIGREARLAVNLSAAALLTPAVRRALAALPLDRMIVEITEHEIVEDYATVTAAIEPLRAEGLLVAVDDTGAGYASLRHLLHLQPDIVKLDISLVGGVDASRSQQALIEALVRLTRAQGSRLVAEGVETGLERDCLTDLGVPLGQGYAIARPMAPDALLDGLHAAGIRTSASPVALVR
ncbi:MAG TPA: EAL domain-containing protein [Mycobacteriales bacterium]|nr:EAL domain-containing protein [Mycobacteriales bacterium]